MMSTSLYDLMGVPRDATQRDIKLAYRQLALLYHPDKNPNDPQAETRFKLINNSYQILSDPVRRAQYDLLLNYQEFHASTTYSQSSEYDTPYEPPPPSPPPVYRKKSHFNTPAEDERVARIWVSIFFVFMVVAMIVYGFTDNYLEKKQEEDRLAQKTSMLGKAIEYFQKEDYRSSLEELAVIISQQPGERDLRVFQDEVFEKLKGQADLTYAKAEYRKTLEYIDILNQFEKRLDLKTRFLLAECYQNLGDYREALEVLDQITQEQQDDLRSLLEAGQIYNRHLGEHQKAEEVLDKAVKKVINGYRNEYGDAFPMLVNPNKTPLIQFEIFFERASVRLELGKYREALQDCSWAGFLQEANGEIPLLTGRIHLANRNNTAACTSFREAAKKGSDLAQGYLARHCR